MRKDMETKLTAECSKLESDVTPEDLKNVADRVIPTNRSGKCLHACLIENLGIVCDKYIDICEITILWTLFCLQFRPETSKLMSIVQNPWLNMRWMMININWTLHLPF